MKNVLVIAPQFVGDSILAIPFLRELKKHVGRVQIDVLSKNSGCLIFQRCPYVENVYNLNNFNFMDLRKKNYGKVYILKRSFSAALLGFLLGIKERIGFSGQFREPLLTKVVKYNRNENKHELSHFMDILKADYVEVNSEALEFYANKSALDGLAKHFGEKKKALVVAYTSTVLKNWTVDGFSKTVDFLEEKGYDVYFVGLPHERAYCDNVCAKTKSKSAKNLCGELNFDEVIALISEMDFVFGIDSGFCHVAAAFGKKVVTIFGHTSIAQWAPVGSTTISLNLPCAPCNKPKNCKNNLACLKTLTADKVISELEKVL